ncbi:hypothetical protein KM043_003353 [Ampulex compressa]|nr:hypothetical protein KM043_003353 [Ampulex compressa]
MEGKKEKEEQRFDSGGRIEYWRRAVVASTWLALPEGKGARFVCENPTEAPVLSARDSPRWFAPRAWLARERFPGAPACAPLAPGLPSGEHRSRGQRVYGKRDENRACTTVSCAKEDRGDSRRRGGHLPFRAWSRRRGIERGCEGAREEESSSASVPSVEPSPSLKARAAAPLPAGPLANATLRCCVDSRGQSDDTPTHRWDMVLYAFQRYSYVQG